MLRVGAIVFVLGSGPLIAVMLAAALGLTADPNPNPVGFGILAFLTFWPAVIMMLVGIGIGLSKGRPSR